ncbi:hypothetical protein KCP75_22220 [Salmonella enterica subsp. enterica]|nr:hypothetical protein KCP75_22220 [Salmonella enterica subsp. enterica]
MICSIRRAASSNARCCSGARPVVWIAASLPPTFRGKALSLRVFRAQCFLVVTAQIEVH